MSFLPAQQIVRTSVLSPRWRHLWTSAPCLDIDIEKFDGNEEKFCKFIDRLLLLREAAPLDKFRLHSLEMDQANLWIQYAIDHNVQVLEFAVYEYCEPFKWNHGVSFASRHLRSLVLTNVSLDTSVFRPLNYACPVLENPEMRYCDTEVTEISSSSLKNLYIIDCFLGGDLLICTPGVVTLCFKRPRRLVVSFENLSSLMAASITLDDDVHLFDDHEDGDKINGDYSILHGLLHAQSLELLAPLGEVILERELARCPMFNNLKSLSLGEWCMAAEFYPLVCLLRYSPILEKLTLKLDMVVWKECQEMEAASLPKGRAFTCDHLKRVTIHCRKADERINSLVTMLCANATSLEEINIKQF